MPFKSVVADQVHMGKAAATAWSAGLCRRRIHADDISLVGELPQSLDWLEIEPHDVLVTARNGSVQLFGGVLSQQGPGLTRQKERYHASKGDYRQDQPARAVSAIVPLIDALRAICPKGA